MISLQVNPGLALLLGAVVALLAPLNWRSTVALLASLGALALAFTPSFGEYAEFAQIGLKLTALRLDALSQTFGVLFALASIMLSLHGADPRARAETGVLLLLAGGAVTAVYSGDFISFVAAAELCTLAAVALLLLRGEQASQEAGMRLLGWQALSSMLFLSGAAFSIVERGGADFERLSPREAGGALILLAFGVKAGFPLAHLWFKEAAARTSDAGGAAVMTFTTLLGVYGLMRAYAGEPALIVIGLAMALLPTVYAIAEDDLRRALAYGVVAQTGIIVAAIGIGSPLALSGAAAHAFATGLAAMLMAMALGAVRERTGTVNASRLGGLARTMPVATVLACVAGLSIAGAPLTAGYASLSLVLEAAANTRTPYFYALMVAAVALGIAHTAIRIPFAAFFARTDAPAPAPGLFGSRHLAMLYAGALIIGVGVAPRWLYAFLPSDPTRFAAYDWSRLATHVQILAFAALAVVLARAVGLYPGEKAGRLADLDAVIHGPLWRLVQRAGAVSAELSRRWRRGELMVGGRIAHFIAQVVLEQGARRRPLANEAAWFLLTMAAGLVLFVGCISLGV